MRADRIDLPQPLPRWEHQQAHQLHQIVGETRHHHPGFIHEKVCTAQLIGKEAALSFFDVVLHLTAFAVELDDRFRWALEGGQEVLIGDIEVLHLLLGYNDQPARPAPASCSVLGNLVMFPLIIPESRVMINDIGTQPFQQVVVPELNDVVDAIPFRRFVHLGSSKAAVSAQYH